MNAKRIDQIIEVLFQGGPEGYPDDLGPEPLNKRFSWKEPTTGQRPPAPPSEIMPSEQDVASAETIPPATPPLAADRRGRHSMNDLIPKSELATIDDLLDRYLAMQKTHGPGPAKTWFDKYRTAEFESLIARTVTMLLEGAEDVFRIPEKDLPFVQQLADERGIPLEQAIRDYLEMYGNEPAGSPPIRMKGRRFGSKLGQQFDVPPYMHA